ncbi:MAG: hypothetical protein WAM60_07580 [Candidatus Promineifilaceae bacterium]
MRTRRFHLPITLFLFALGFLFFSSSHSASAAGVEYEANWVVHVDFVGNQVNADLIVQVWEFTNGEETDYLETTRNLNCQVRSGVAIDNNTATFSGGKGIVCFVPNRRQIIYDMTEGGYIPPTHCELQKGAFAQSDVVLDPNGTGQVRMNPLFTMPDLSLDAIMPPSSNYQTLMHFSVDGQSADSPQFSANPEQNTLQAFFNQVNDPEGGDLAYQPFFVINGMVFPSVLPDVDENLSLSLTKSRLDIGYSPVTDERLFGQMLSLDIDPGCFPPG